MSNYVLRIPAPVAELDPYGELKTTAQIQLLQLVAARASAAVGFPPAWYERNGVTWIVRYTHLEQVRPIRHADDLSIQTWVSDFRRVRSWRHYEIREAAGGATKAKAKTDWVLVDTTTHAPTAIPDELQKAFMPDGVATEPRPRRIRLPHGDTAPPVPLRRVEWADLDSLGHVNNSYYAAFAIQALLAKLALSGWAPSVTSASPHLRLDTLEIEYLTPALIDNQLSARVVVEPGSSNGIRALIEILTDDNPVVRVIGAWRWTDSVLPKSLVDAMIG